MNTEELKRRIARLKREKKEEEERRKLRRIERGAISEAREAVRERRIAGIGLGLEKAKVYKALPLPHIRPRDPEEAIRRAEQRAEKAEAEARRQIALSQRRTETARARAETSKAEAEQRAEEREVRKTQLLTERELRAARLRPYTEAATKAAKVTSKLGIGVGKVGLGIGREAVRGLQWLGKEGQKPRKRATEEPPLDMSIDLGLGGTPKREKPPEEPPLDLHIKIE